MQNKIKENSNNGTLHKLNALNDGMQASRLMVLFEEELKGIYWAEKALVSTLPEMIKNATSLRLCDALTYNLSETEAQVVRIEQVFTSIGRKAVAIKCAAMEKLIKEVREVIKSCEDGAMCDAAIIIVLQKVEHYEIATYGTLRQFAATLGLTEAMHLLKESLEEEKEADERLSVVAISTINAVAAREVHCTRNYNKAGVRSNGNHDSNHAYSILH